MISQEDAEAVARRVIDEPDPYWPDRPAFVITKVQPHRLGWLFYYQSQLYVDTGNVSDALVGNGPILVAARDGSYVAVGTAAPIEARIAEAERQLEGGGK